MPNLHLQINDELMRFLEAEAARAGFSGPDEYARDLLRRASMIEGHKTAQSDSGDGRGEAKSPFDIALELGRSIPDEALEKLPRDGARNVDHYLYGAPKRD